MALVSRSAALCALALVAPASPAAAVEWTKITGKGEPASINQEIGLAYGGTGPFFGVHVLWTHERTVFSTRIEPNPPNQEPQVFGPFPVFTYDDPGGGVSGGVHLVSYEKELRAFFAGLYPNHPLDVGLATATSSDGISWTVQPTLASASAPGKRAVVYAAQGIGGTVFQNGTPLSIWGDSRPGEAAYHVGTSDQDDDFHLSENTATVGGPNAATDGKTGDVAIAWNDLDAGRVLVQSIAPAGPRMKTPGGRAPDGLERVSITGRIGFQHAGIYVAYLKGTNGFLSRPAVWRIGAAEPMVVSSQRGARFVGVTKGPEGRLWAFWAGRKASGAWRIYAARSNKKAKQFGAVVTLKPPSGTDSVSSLEGINAGDTYVDLLALVQRSPSDVGNWFARAAPGITLEAKQFDFNPGGVRFRTFDAGEPLATTIHFAGQTRNTGPDGEVFTDPVPAGTYTAKATAQSYTPAELDVKIPPKN